MVGKEEEVALVVPVHTAKLQCSSYDVLTAYRRSKVQGKPLRAAADMLDGKRKRKEVM